MKARPAAGALLGLLAIGLFVGRLGWPHQTSYADQPWLDLHRYVAMRHDLTPCIAQPWCWRVGVPYTAHLLPIAADLSFLIVSATAAVLTCALVWVLLRDQGIDEVRTALTVGLALTVTWWAKSAVLYPWLTDSALIAFITAGMVLVVRRRPDRELAVLLALGVLFKEPVIAVVAFRYSWRAVRLLDWQEITRSVLTAIPAVVVLIAVRLVLPASTGPDFGQGVRWGLEKFSHEGVSYLVAITLGAFGVFLCVLGALGTWSRPMIAIRLSPLILAAYGNLLIAGSGQRLVMLALPALVWLAALGAERVPTWALAVAVAVGGALSLWRADEFTGAAMVTIEALVAVVLAGLVVAQRQRSLTAA